MISRRPSARAGHEPTYHPIFGLGTPDGHQLVVLTPGKVSRTMDQGRTWSVLATPRTLTQVQFGQERFGVGVGPGCIGITHDGGSTWTFSELSKEWIPNDVWCGTSERVFVVGQVVDGTAKSSGHGFFGQSNDKGATWHWADVPEVERLDAVQATGSGDALLLGSTRAHEGVVLRARERVRTVTLKVPYELHTFWLSENLMLAGGLGGRILRGESPDSVREWMRLSEEDDEDEVVSITALKEGHWVIVTNARAWLVDDGARRREIVEDQHSPLSACIETFGGVIWLGSVDGSLRAVTLHRGRDGGVEPAHIEVVRLPRRLRM